MEPIIIELSPKIEGANERRIEIAPGVFGLFQGENGQAWPYRLEFDPERFDAMSAKAWYEQNGWFAAMLRFSSEEIVEIDALVFRAGEYPDKGLSVTDDDLRRLAQNTRSAPLYIEHRESALKTGEAVRFKVRDGALWAVLRMFKSAYDWISKGAKVFGLSVGLSPDLSRIIEVSHVENPRVADARLFAGAGLRFNVNEEDEKMADDVLTADQAQALIAEAVNDAMAKAIAENERLKAEFSDELAERERRIADLEAQNRRMAAKREVEKLIEAGRLVPAQRELAERLFALDGKIAFGEDEIDVAEAVRGLIAMNAQIDLGPTRRESPAAAFQTVSPGRFKYNGGTE